MAGVGGAGGRWPGPVVGKMLARSGYAITTAVWEAPPGVVTAELDRLTGTIADATTPPERRYTEYFLSGTEPGALRVDGRGLFGLGPIPF